MFYWIGYIKMRLDGLRYKRVKIVDNRTTNKNRFVQMSEKMRKNYLANQ